PYMATEDLLMAAVSRGGDRQELHEIIRRHAHAAMAEEKAESAESTLLQRLQADPAFAGIDLASALAPARYIGRAAQQVDDFVATVRQQYPHLLNQADTVAV